MPLGLKTGLKRVFGILACQWGFKKKVGKSVYDNIKFRQVMELSVDFHVNILCTFIYT